MTGSGTVNMELHFPLGKTGEVDIQQFGDSRNSFQFHDKRKRSGLVVIAWKNLTQ